MANTFGILTALVLAFTAFVAFKNNEEFDKQVDNTAAQQVSLDRNEKTFNGLVDDNEELLADAVAANESRDELNTKLESQNDENDSLETMIADKGRELDRIKAEVADAEDTLKEVGEVSRLAPKIDALNAEIAELEDQVAVLKANIDRLGGEKTRTAGALASAKSKLSDITSGRSLPAMEAKVESIDRRLGFVMLSAGIESGVVGGSRIAVMRGGEKIAELSVSAVSAKAATADIVHSTLKEGENIVVGDTVVPVEGLMKAAN